MAAGWDRGGAHAGLPGCLGSGGRVGAAGAGERVARDPARRSRVAVGLMLGELHAQGILTDEEFASKKAELLARL